MSIAVPPPLLNEELIQHALQNLHHLNNAHDLKIKTCDFNIFPANGENFGSEIYKVEVKYELDGNSKNQSFIVKITIPEETELGTNEEIMLKTVVPAMEIFLNEITPENLNNKFHAKCLLSESKPVEFYVLENLNSLEYYCANRSKGLNFEHAKILVQKIAKFHAVSMIFNKKYPEIVKSLLVSQFECENLEDNPKPFTYGCLKYVSSMIKTWPSYETISASILSTITKFNRLAFEAVNSKNSKFNVINHGDLWINNFLYKYNKESGKPIDVLFVDFQLSFWGSCGVDINAFLNSSLELQVLKDKRQELIQNYYVTLKQTLELMNYCQDEIPTLEDIVFEVKCCEFIGFYIALCEFPMIALDKSQSQGVDSKIFNQPEKMEDLRKIVYSNARVVETLKYSLKYFEKINLFEF